MEIDHEIFSTIILSLLLIQEGQLSVSGERMCTILVNRLEDKACLVNVWLAAGGVSIPANGGCGSGRGGSGGGRGAMHLLDGGLRRLPAGLVGIPASWGRGSGRGGSHVHKQLVVVCVPT